MKGGNLEPEVFKEMIKGQAKIKDNKYFGLGFEVYDFGNGDYGLAHGGSDSGTRCMAFIIPKSKKGIVIFTNTDDGTKSTISSFFIIWVKKERKSLK